MDTNECTCYKFQSRSRAGMSKKSERVMFKALCRRQIQKHKGKVREAYRKIKEGEKETKNRKGKGKKLGAERFV